MRTNLFLLNGTFTVVALTQILSLKKVPLIKWQIIMLAQLRDIKALYILFWFETTFALSNRFQTCIEWVHL